MEKILCAGSACQDIFFPTNEGKIIETPEDLTSQRKIAFELGAKYKIEKTYKALGGCAANVACGLARLGIESYCAAVVGEDSRGGWIKEELEKNEVKTDFLVLQKGGESDLSAIIIDAKTAERTIFSNKNSNGILNLFAEKIKEINWIFIGDISGHWEEQLESVFQMAEKEKKFVAFNPREAHIHENPAEVIQAVSLSEIVFVNKDEAVELISFLEKNDATPNINSEKFLLEKLKSLEAEIVVLTDGEKGAWAYDGKDMLYSPGLKVPAVDSTGAGDSFCSGFLAARVKGKDLSECLRWGIANSSNEVQFYGSIEGLLSEEVILKKITEIKTEKL